MLHTNITQNYTKLSCNTSVSEARAWPWSCNIVLYIIYVSYIYRVHQNIIILNWGAAAPQRLLGDLGWRPQSSKSWPGATWCITLHQRCTFHRNTQLSTNTPGYKYTEVQTQIHKDKGTSAWLCKHCTFIRCCPLTPSYCKNARKHRRLQIHV